MANYTIPGANEDCVECASGYFQQLRDVLQCVGYETVDEIAACLHDRYENGKAVFLIGNGGSASTASHFACDLAKGTVSARLSKRFRVHALTDNLPTITAWANDSSYADIFSEQLKSCLQHGDTLFAISGSGNSANILNAIQVAKAADNFVIGLAGFAGGRMKALCDLCLVVPSENMQIIEDVHLSITHALYTMIWHRISKGLNTGPVCAEDVRGLPPKTVPAL